MRNFSMAKYSILLPLLSTFLLAACGGAPIRESLPTISDRLVAKDFAQILVQVDPIAPRNTSLRMANLIGTKNTFDTALKEELQIAGYVIEPITTELVSDTPVVAHNVERTPTADGQTAFYTVMIGEASFRRGYTVGGDGLVQPQTAMEAKGVDTSILSQDDSIFELDGEIRIVNVSAPAVTADASDEVVEVVEVAAADTTDDATDAAIRLPEPIEEELIVIPAVVDASSTEPEENVLFNTQIVDESLLTFDGDSLVLGESNKRRVRNLISGYEPKTDVFSILGCVFQGELSWSEDATQLAIGRSERIQSELLYAGIPATKIRAEACAQDANTGSPVIPVGSVLLLLNRVR